MKKNLLYAAVLVVLLGLAWWLTQKDDRSTLSPEEADFSVADTSTIDKLFIADKTGKTILLEKVAPGQWTVNKKYIARPDAIEFVLSTLLRMEVKAPVPRAAVENIKKQLSTIGKKVEIYSAGKKIDVIYVGGATIDSRGTYVIKEKAELPYIVHIPGWEGYLSPRFFTNLEEWRERIMLRLNPDSIAEIKASFTDTAAQSYVLRMPEPRKFMLYKADGRTVVPVDTTYAKTLFAGFQRYPVEAYDNQGVMRDSIVNMAPHWHELQVTMLNGQTHSFKTYFKSQLNQLDVVLLGVMPDLDRDYFFYEEQNEFGIIQKRSIPWYYFTLSDLRRKD